MTFIEFKKNLLDLDLSIPKFCKLLKINEKNIQAYKKKGYIPNSIAVISQCFIEMKNSKLDYTSMIEHLELIEKSRSKDFIK